MKLTAKQIQDNWKIFLDNIEVHITGKRKDQLLKFYKKVIFGINLVVIWIHLQPKN